jgi:hypothetical protein
MEITQKQVEHLLDWIENRKQAYLIRGFSLAAKTGTEGLEVFLDGPGLSADDAEKPLSTLKAELELAEEFYKDARQIMYAGRQGG